MLDPLSIPREPVADSADVDSYRLIETLTPHRTFLCSDASANVVVLIRLEDDCLHRDGLHPSIRDRLARVRELPHPRVATLRGVERWNGIACLVWIYLDGENWDDFLREHPERFPALASSLAAAVGALHDIGIVHGNLHGRNVIVRPDGQPWMTQVSPYLYTDPNADIAAVVDLLRAGGESLPVPVQTRLDRLLARFDGEGLSLKELSQLLQEIGDDEAVEESIKPVKDSGYRRRSLLGALAVAVVAGALALVLNWSFSKHTRPGPATFPSLKPEGRS